MLAISSPSSNFFQGHTQRDFFCFIFTGPSVFFRKRHTIYHTYMCTCHNGMCTSVSMPGARWLVCSGVRTVIKLSACITRLNHHPAWLSILLLAGLSNNTYTHTHIHLAISQDSRTQSIRTVCLLTLDTQLIRGLEG